MRTLHLLGRSQPQTLQIATIIMYINAVFGLLSLELLNLFGALLVLGSLTAGVGIANEKKWAYWLGVAVAALPIGLIVTRQQATSFISLLFEIALIAVLLHPQSREYQRTWFKLK